MTASAESRGGNFLTRHWRGDTSLGVSYWLNGFFLANVFTSGLIAAADRASDNLGMRAAAFLGLGAFALIYLVSAWSMVGIWRSANRHESRGGKAGWAVLAKCGVVLGIFAFLATTTKHIGPATVEFIRIAANRDQFGVIDARLSKDGRSMLLSGTIGLGSADVVQKVLDGAPTVKVAQLSSGGGRMREAEQIAAMIKDRRLSTYVDGACLSACTVLFLAGSDRAATSSAKIGFHKPSFPGAGGPEMERSVRELYARAGLREDFIKKVLGTPYESMWYPTQQEMIDAQVITRVSLGGETTLGLGLLSNQELLDSLKKAPIWRSANRRFPGVIEEAAKRMATARDVGGNDGEITAAGRSVLIQHFNELIATVNDDLTDEYLGVLVVQLTAVRSAGVEACIRYMEGRLDLVSTLPRHVVMMEQAWIEKALASEPYFRKRPDQERVRSSLAAATRSMSAGLRQTIMNPKGKSDRERCDATTFMWEGIKELPRTERIELTQAMLSS